VKDLRVLIADDDEGMRLVLQKIVDKVSGFKVAAQVANGKEALKIFSKDKFDVVFLDVEMPEVNGIDCAKKISDISPETPIVFATAHDNYMADAFKVYAFDYLVKPFDVKRAISTLKKIKQEALDVQSPALGLNAINSLGKLIVRHREGISFVDTKDIVLAQREDGSTVIYTLTDRITTSEPLGELEKRLDKRMFFRSHKSYIINLNKITKVYPYGRWTYIVKFKGTSRDALITHEKFSQLEKMFS
jgi:two-component system, LytTR family, response regulator